MSMPLNVALQGMGEINFKNLLKDLNKNKDNDKFKFEYKTTAYKHTKSTSYQQLLIEQFMEKYMNVE